MAEALPAISLVAVPGRRQATLELAAEVERRGFSGIYVPSMFGNVAQCVAMALATRHIAFGTAVSPIYASTAQEFAQSAAFTHEVSGGRFRFGIGVAHAPSHRRMGVAVGKPLADTCAFVAAFKAHDAFGPLPPIVLAALRRRMVALAGEIADGVVFANCSLSHMRESLAALPPGKRADPGFLIANMIPTVVSDDLAAARAVHRRTLMRYALLPNYRNYWKEAGYGDEMAAVELALAEGREADVTGCLSDRWLDDNTLSGPPARIRDRLAVWREAGVTTPILVPSSTRGNQLVALQEIFEAFAD